MSETITQKGDATISQKATQRMKLIEIEATEHDSASDAVQWLSCSGDDHAISIGDRYFTVKKAELDRLERLGIVPTTWHNHKGQLVSVPGRC